MPILGNTASQSGKTPGSPTITSVTAGDASVSVAFSAPAYIGKGSATYTAVSSPGGFTNTGSSSPIVVSGLSNGTSYTFTITASTNYGVSGAASATSDPAVPAAPVSQYVAVAHDVSPYVTTYPFTNASGFGSKFSDPATLPSMSVGHAVDFDPSNESIAIGGAYSISAYPWSSSGFGTKFTDPTTPNRYITRLKIAPSGTFAVMSNYTSSPYMHGYAYSKTSGFGSKFSNPTTLPGDEVYGCDVSPNSTVMTVAGYTTGNSLNAYAVSSSGFGSRYASPSGVPDNCGGGVFNSSGNTVLVNSRNYDYMMAWAWSGSGWGSKYAGPAGNPNVWGLCSAFNRAGTVTAYGRQSGSPLIDAWAWSSGFGSKYSAPATIPSGSQVGDISFNYNDTAIVTMPNQSPWVEAYAWSNSSGFGTKYSNPATLPTGYSLNAKFSY